MGWERSPVSLLWCGIGSLTFSQKSATIRSLDWVSNSFTGVGDSASGVAALAKEISILPAEVLDIDSVSSYI